MQELQRSASFPAFGGVATVAVAEAELLTAAVDAVSRTVEGFDRACSRFRADSELTALNAAGGGETRVSALLFEALEAALRAAQLTDGDVDPTIGGALIALGYDRDFDALDRVRPVVPRISASSVPGWRAVHLDPERHTARLRRGVKLDLGATAKALASDHAAARAAEATGCGVLVSLSGDISVCGEAPSDGWLVRVTDEHRAGPHAPGQTIALTSGGLATSSRTVRRWSTSEGEAHHLLDPETSLPAGGPWRTVSVCAGSCLDANIASTASIVRGESARGWLTSLDLPARLVGSDGSVFHVAGWPKAGDDLVSFAPVGAPA
jgi:thiamine biosynthesis lipoprotein